MRSPFTSGIAGLYYHCDENDHGSFKGYILPEDNPHDPNAIAIYSCSNKLIGYIPRCNTAYVRMWTSGIDKLDCDISLEIIPEANVYRGAVTIYDESGRNDTPFTNKKVYVCHDFTYYRRAEVIAIAESFGAIIARSLRNDIDFVIYEKSVPDNIKSKEDNPNFYFEEIHLYDFIAQCLSEEERDDRFFGKEVAFASSRNTEYASLTARYIIEHGGRLIPRYKKRTTEILIQWDKWSNNVTVNKAIENGKIIIRAADILGDEDNSQSDDTQVNKKPQTNREIANKSEESRHFKRKELEAFKNAPSSFTDKERMAYLSSLETVNKKQDSSGCGILITLIIICSIILMIVI